MSVLTLYVLVLVYVAAGAQLASGKNEAGYQQTHLGMASQPPGLRRHDKKHRTYTVPAYAAV